MGFPAIVEVKKGEEWGGLSALFCQIVQGLAYTLTVRHLWTHQRFSEEWSRVSGMLSEGVSRNSPLTPSDVTPIIALGDETYWNGRMATYAGARFKCRNHQF